MQSSLRVVLFPMNCTPLVWSPTTSDALGPTVSVCAIALFIHTIFWIQVLIVSTLRERTMMWLYAYLSTDYFLLIRFFIFLAVCSPVCSNGGTCNTGNTCTCTSSWTSSRCTTRKFSRNCELHSISDIV